MKVLDPYSCTLLLSSLHLLSSIYLSLVSSVYFEQIYPLFLRFF